jgi:hypothetical protein
MSEAPRSRLGGADYIDALVSGLPAPQREEHLIMLLQGFFDDSGSHPESGWYVLAGFISTTGNWKRFSDEWSASLSKDPAIDYFKMSEAHRLTGEFEGWPRPLRDQKVLELAEVAERFAVARIAAVVNQADYNRFIKGVSPWAELDDPYFMLFNQIIVLTAQFIKHLEDRQYPELDFSQTEVDFVFDDQGKIGLNALGWWDVLKQALDKDLVRILGSSPIFISDRKVLPLQAADLYAWHARHVFEGGDITGTRTAAVISTLKKVPPYGGQVTGEQMRDSLPELIAISEKYRT